MRVLKAIGVGVLAYFAAGIVLLFLVDTVIPSGSPAYYIATLLIAVFGILVGVRWYRQNKSLGE